MSQLVHVQTQIAAAFGILDDEGNVIHQQPITATLGKFSADAFAEAFAAIQAERDRLILTAELEQIPALDGGGE